MPLSVCKTCQSTVLTNSESTFRKMFIYQVTSKLKLLSITFFRIKDGQQQRGSNMGLNLFSFKNDFNTAGIWEVYGHFKLIDHGQDACDQKIDE